MRWACRKCMCTGPKAVRPEAVQGAVRLDMGTCLAWGGRASHFCTLCAGLSAELCLGRPAGTSAAALA